MNLSGWDHAARLSEDLARILPGWDSPNAQPTDAMKRSVEQTWFRIIADAKVSKVNLTPEYLSSVYTSLLATSDVAASAVFENGKPPLDWATFTLEVFESDAEINGAEAWIVAQLFWGEHVRSMKFCLAWLVMNGLRLQNGLPGLLPPDCRAGAFADALLAAGPPDWDAESLRAIIGSFEREQA